MGKPEDIKPAGTVEETGNGMLANRHQARHAMMIDSFRHVIADATVLVLGAEDGRWCCDMAAAGALHVVGIEENADLVAAFNRLPGLGMRERIEMRCDRPLEALDDEADGSRTHDVVALFDALEDVADLHTVFARIRLLRPLMVLGDGLFARTDVPLLRFERHRGPVASRRGVRLIPSRGAVTMAAQDAGFEVEWTDWDMLPEAARAGLSDYYQSGPLSRASFTLLPEG
jgi:hypothetical protein